MDYTNCNFQALEGNECWMEGEQPNDKQGFESQTEGTKVCTFSHRLPNNDRQISWHIPGDKDGVMARKEGDKVGWAWDNLNLGVSGNEAHQWNVYRSYDVPLYNFVVTESLAAQCTAPYVAFLTVDVNWNQEEEGVKPEEAVWPDDDEL